MSTSAMSTVRRMPPWLPRALPFACYILFLAVAPSVEHLLPDPRWMYAVQVCAVSLLLAVFARSYSELWQAPRFNAKQWLVALATGTLVFVLWINLDFPALMLGSSEGFDPRDAAARIDWPLAMVRVVGAALVVPVMEELFWRSLVMRRLDRDSILDLDPRACSLTAMLFSSIVFGLEHTLWFAGIIAGLAYGMLYRHSGNLWNPIIAHATTNLLLAIWVLNTGHWQFW